jgi:hypothetical protein
MASKKYLLLLVVVLFTTVNSFSQAPIRTGRIGNSYDSSQIPQRRMAQHTEYLNGTNNFPAKPRNMWEIGIKGGLFQVAGDVPAKFLSPGFGIHVRKAFGYIFSMRLEYLYGIGKGYHFRAAGNYAKNPAWGANLTNPGQRYSAPRTSPSGPGGSLINVSSVTGLATTPFETVYYNYKSVVQDLSLEGIITLNNIRFHKAKTKYVLYGIAGVGGTIYDTKVNALNGATKYNFQAISQSAYKNRQTFLKNMRNTVLDKTFETPAENQGDRRPKLFGDTFKPSATVGMGIGISLSKRLSLALEDRWTFVKDDLLDGQRWQEHAYGDAVLTRDFDSYNFLSLGLNLNLGAKSVEPLWWLNPLDYAYAEIRNPHPPKPVCMPDTDGDGVPDCFDLEQTPAGCPVDTHGVTKDTDGDGVPDCKDKELITPTYCQPVDADGIGKCPCPDGCIGIPPPPKTCSEKLGALPVIQFNDKNAKDCKTLTADAIGALKTAAEKIRNNPGCNVVVVGYCCPDNQGICKKAAQLCSWEHVNAIINYMVESEGISKDRFIFRFGDTNGDCHSADLRAANDGETGPNTVPRPPSNYR